MFNNILPTISLTLGETLLSLYPLLIKSIPSPLSLQVLIRCVCLSIGALLFKTSMTSVFTLNSVLVGILNIIHIFGSYIGFTYLNVGVSLAIFYLYPLVNVIFKSFITNTAISSQVWLYFIISIIGVIVMTYTPTTSIESTTSKVIMYGLIGIIIAMITESIIYSYLKFNSNSSNPFDMLFEVYIWSAIIMSLYFIFKKFINTDLGGINTDLGGINTDLGGINTDSGGINTDTLLKLIVINIIIGIGGHILRYFSLVKVSTEWFSILSFLEIIIGFVLGYWLYNEPFGQQHLIGTILIAISIYGINSLGFK